MRIEQPPGTRGSLKWIQKAVNVRPSVLNNRILPLLSGATSIQWLSPLQSDAYAEYRDRSFLKAIDEEALTERLREFWPERGPQWDGLGRSDKGHVLLVEAKAHIAEMFSPPTSAGPTSKARIEEAFRLVIADLRATPKATWTDCFYQYANRLAHLWFLVQNGVPAKLVLVGFLGDEEMNGPTHPEAWRAAFEVMDYVLGLRQHALAHDVIHLAINVDELD